MVIIRGTGVLLLYLFCNKSHYENVPFEIPENWVWTTIEDIAESNIGLTYKPTDICANGVPVYRSNNIQNRRICLKELVRVNTNILEKQYLQEGDLLICARNGSLNLVGKCAIIDNLNEPTSFGAFMAVCRSALNPWIFQILNSEYFNTYLDDSNSTAINQVTQKMLLAFQLPIPPAAEQERIISKLKQWYEYIDEIEDRKIELESYIKQTKSKILDLAISGKLVPQDPNDEPAIELLKRINPAFKPCDNSHYGNLPGNWEEIVMGEICKLYDGEKVSGPSLTYIDVKYLRGFKVGEFVTCGKYVPQGSTLILVDGENSGEVFTTPIDGYQGSTFKILDITEYLDKEYVLLLIKRSQKLLRENKVGSAIPHLNKKMFKELIVPVPPLAEQKRIVATVNMLFYKLDMITAEL